MPELPEVETIRRGLERTILKRRIGAVHIFEPRVITGSAFQMIDELTARAAHGVRRHGKWLFLDFDSFSLSIHLRMTGTLLYVPAGTPRENSTHIVLRFDDGEGELHYGDVRKFGRWEILYEPKRHVESVPDAWLAPKTAVIKSLMNRTGMIKHALLSQKAISGLGNIYVDETLHRAKIHPRRRIEKISPQKIDVFYTGMKEILKKSIEIGGTSFRDYVDTEGQRGGYKEWLVVYGKAGSDCACGGKIRRIVVAGRGTFYCPKCQK